MQIPSRLAPVVFTAILFTHSARAETEVSGTRAEAERHAVINVTELASREQSTSLVPRQLHRPLTAPGKMRLPAPLRQESRALLASIGSGPSPAMTTNFLALFDDRSSVPPDTMGAVGPNHIVTMLNSQVRIVSRSTGAILSTVTLNSFWSALGGPDTFDPHITYDPFNDRWIASCSADAEIASASVLVGVSATNDPTSDWFLFRTDADPTNAAWPDFDELGFNKTWVVITGNMFRNKGGLEGVWVWAYDKADLYANGSGTATLLKFVDPDPNFFSFSVIPAQMHENVVSTMYLAEDWDNTAGQLRVSTITGSIGAEVLTSGTSFPTSTPWGFAGGKNFAPQFGSKTGIDAGDSRLLSCFFRNGSLWASHTTFLPAGAPTHCVAQWWQFLPNGTVQQFGRVEDPTGNLFFAYPSLAVNANDDMLLGYSRLSKSQFASGNYSFRFGTDAPNTLRTDAILRAGDAVYSKVAGGNNRWGDYSATCVDPVNDLSLWTLQEFAADNNNWGTWWGRIDANPAAVKLGLTRPAAGISYPTAPTVTLTATRFDSGTSFDKVEFFSDGQKIGEDATEPFSITWTGAADGAHSLRAIATLTGGGSSTSALAAVHVGDPASPVGIWETKITSADAKGNEILFLNDDFSITGHGMTLGDFGLFTITGTWSFDQTHRTLGSYTTDFLTGSFVAKVAGGKKFTAVFTPTSLVPIKLKGVPSLPAPDISGDWTATVKVGSATSMENYHFSVSPLFRNVFDVTGSVTGSILETSKGVINFATDGPPARSLAGKANPTSLTAKGVDENSAAVSIKATKP